MRFLIIVKTTSAAEAEGIVDSGLMQQMAAFHEVLAKAGVLLDGAGLQPISKGGRIRYDGCLHQVGMEPDAESKELKPKECKTKELKPKELMAGYMLIQARTREEALEWGRRFPGPGGQGGVVEIEVWPIHGLEAVPAGANVVAFKGRDD